ncbi:MAG: gliding motility-associated C-terminal domain-containing protein [Bacteroidales bacterium]|nr:gliding motility-associated C-terminal domain-containing protein [Bacteroidales bacterium]
MKPFNEHLQEKLNAYEYPYQEGSWELVQRKLKIRKIWKWGRITVATIAVVASSIVIFNQIQNQKVNNRDQVSKQKIEKIDSKISQTPQMSNKQNETSSIYHSAKDIIKNNNKTIAVDNSNISTKNIDVNSNNHESINNNVNTTVTSINVNFTKSTSQGCVPLDVIFNANVNAKNVDCVWDFGDGSYAYEFNTHHEYKKGGKYNVSLKVKTSDGQIFTSEPQTVQVWYAPKAIFEYSTEENCINLKNLSKQSTFVNWYINDSLVSDESTHFCFNKSGKAVISLLVENKEGCIDSISKTIELVYKMPVKFANAFTPDGDGVNDLFGPQVLDESFYSFKMFIYNKLGKCVYEANGNHVYWDGTDMNTKQLCMPDDYFYKVLVVDKLGNKNEFSGKIQLKR